MRALTVIAGLLSGALVAVLLLALNPFAGGDREAPGTSAYSFVSNDVAGMRRGAFGVLNLSLLADTPPDFHEPTIENSYAAITMLRDAQGGPAGLGVKLASADSGGNLLTGDVGLKTYWLVFWPNQGSIHARGYESLWPVVSDSLLSAVFGGPLAARNESYEMSVVDADKEGVWKGLSGIYYDDAGYMTTVITGPGIDNDIFQGELELQPY